MSSIFDKYLELTESLRTEPLREFLELTAKLLITIELQEVTKNDPQPYEPDLTFLNSLDLPFFNSLISDLEALRLQSPFKFSVIAEQFLLPKLENLTLLLHTLEIYSRHDLAAKVGTIIHIARGNMNRLNIRMTNETHTNLRRELAAIIVARDSAAETSQLGTPTANLNDLQDEPMESWRFWDVSGESLLEKVQIALSRDDTNLLAALCRAGIEVSQPELQQSNAQILIDYVYRIQRANLLHPDSLEVIINIFTTRPDLINDMDTRRQFTELTKVLSGAENISSES